MMPGFETTKARSLLAMLAIALLPACATLDYDRNLATVNEDVGVFTGGRLELARTQEAVEARETLVTELLRQPLGQNDAVQLALANSPDLQAMLANNWFEAATAAQSGRIRNPVFGFERLRIGDELELARMLSFGLLDLLLLPQRYQMARDQSEAARLRLAIDVVDQVTQVRHAWVNAVAARQRVQYAEQVYSSAEASAELARRMQAVGNFNRLSRARQQTYYADAATQLALARLAELSNREELVRQLGLTDSQSLQLKLPPRLPELPEQPRSTQEIVDSAGKGRLDVRLAAAALNATAKAEGVDLATSYTDIELALRRKTKSDDAGGERRRGRGYEIEIELPLFDWGDVKRESMSARSLAAAHHLEATVRAAGSNLREAYATYRTAYDLARHFRDEVVPLRREIADENILRYNGMLIGVFDLLADSREQIASVSAAIAAAQQFWLTDAALQAAVIGKPVTVAVTGMVDSSGGRRDAAH